MPRPRLSPAVIVPLVAAGLLGTLFLPTVPSEDAARAQSAATATPTARVIRVGRSDASPTPLPVSSVGTPATPSGATATPTPQLQIEGAAPVATIGPSPTPTPWLLVEDETPPALATATPFPPTATPAPTATPTPPPTATPTPTPLPPPTATPTPALPPTIAPASSSRPPTIAPPALARATFAAESWSGGFYRGDSVAYGRPWVAVYGAFSPYPQASLVFKIDGRPRGDATFTLTGLDDEWIAANDVSLVVNGVETYRGASPFPNWDGIGDGANAAWTQVAFTIPDGILRAGQNEIVFANLTPADSFNAPPYVLLADAAIAIPLR